MLAEESRGQARQREKNQIPAPSVELQQSVAKKVDAYQVGTCGGVSALCGLNLPLQALGSGVPTTYQGCKRYRDRSSLLSQAVLL